MSDAQKVAINIIKRMEGYPPTRHVQGIGLDHAHWMLLGVSEGYIKGEKAHRWVGYAQGLLVFEGHATLEEMKADSRAYC